MELRPVDVTCRTPREENTRSQVQASGAEEGAQLGPPSGNDPLWVWTGRIQGECRTVEGILEEAPFKVRGGIEPAKETGREW